MSLKQDLVAVRQGLCFQLPPNDNALDHHSSPYRCCAYTHIALFGFAGLTDDLFPRHGSRMDPRLPVPAEASGSMLFFFCHHERRLKLHLVARRIVEAQKPIQHGKVMIHGGGVPVIITPKLIMAAFYCL